MIKVKNYLDKYFFSYHTEVTSELKSNGQYCVNGYWEYPKGIREEESIRYGKLETNEEMISFKFKDQITLSINNETLLIRTLIINGESVSKYSYLQTYLHLPRTEPDINGYYVRSTDDEIIYYLNNYLNWIKRDEKLNKLLK